MENEWFQLQNFAKTVEMAASSSKMLQNSKETGRKADPQKKSPKRKHIIPKRIPHPFFLGVYGFGYTSISDNHTVF